MNQEFSATAASASSIAPRVDHLFLALVIVSGVLVIVLIVTNLFFLVRYRRGSNAVRPPRAAEGKIETIWITGTTGGFLVFFFWGARLYVDLERPPAEAQEIQVVGRQWMWDVRQPNGRREFDELHVPTGQAIRLLLTSEDVIHSFFVPAFRVKQDVVPGKTVSLWFEATKAGVYRLFCTQFCGTKHAEMSGEVIALPPEAYAAWLAEGNRDGDAIARGRQLFVRYGCAGCHAASSSFHAPALDGLYRRRVALADGSFVEADDQYLRDSILEPTKQVVAGYSPVMP